MASSYLPLNTNKELREAMERALVGAGAFRGRFNFVAATGVSGIIGGLEIALTTGARLVVVRKSPTEAHGNLIEGTYLEGEPYIIVDDFVNTGRTVLRVVKMLGWWPVGIVLYAERGTRAPLLSSVEQYAFVQTALLISGLASR